MGTVHFEELWEKGELSSDPESTPQEILSELEIKFSILKSIVTTELQGKDRQQAVGTAFGSLLKTLTYLSMKENINVYAALTKSLEE